MILYSKWLGLPLNTRVLLADKFGIQKKGSIEVFANTVKSDGYLVLDIEQALTKESLQAALNSKETDINKLFDDAVLLVTGKYEESNQNKGGTISGDEGKRKVPAKTKVHKRKVVSSGNKRKS